MFYSIDFSVGNGTQIVNLEMITYEAVQKLYRINRIAHKY